MAPFTAGNNPNLNRLRPLHREARRHRQKPSAALVPDLVNLPGVPREVGRVPRPLPRVRTARNAVKDSIEDELERVSKIIADGD
jgi:hypothetical protein